MTAEMGHPRKWAILAAVTSCISLIFLDATVLPVSLPTIHRELAISEVGLQWTINSYLLALTICLLLGGHLADSWGQKQIFCLGLIVFAAASVLCGLSYTAALLIGARALQGVGGALIIPTSGLIIFNAFPKQQRGKAIGLYVSIGSIFLALGPTIGGVLTEYFSWRYIFWVNLPVALFGLVLSSIYVPQSIRHKERFDTFGFLALAIAISGVTVALMQSPEWGILSWSFGISFGVGILFFGIILAIPHRHHQIIRWKLFSIPTYFRGAVSMLLAQMILMVGVYWAIYFQNILGYTPAQAGGISFIANAPLILFAPLAGHLVDRIGAKIPVGLGYLLLTFSLLWFVTHPHPASVVALLPALIPLGCGVPLIFTPSFVGALHDIDEKERGRAMGLYNTLRQLGSTLGMAILSMMFLKVLNTRFTATLSANPETSGLDPQQLQGVLAKTINSTEILKNLPPNVAQTVVFDFKEAYVRAFQAINLAAGMLGLLGFFIVLFFFKKKRSSL